MFRSPVRSGLAAIAVFAAASCAKESSDIVAPERGRAPAPPPMPARPPVGPEGPVLTPPVGVSVSRWSGVMEATHFKYNPSGPGPGLKIDLRTNMETDFTLSAVTVAVDGNVGWHTHNGPVFINVRAGTLTLLEYHDGKCLRRDVTAPASTMLEQGTGIHNAYNLTGAPAEYATAAWAPRGVPQRVDISPAPPCTP